jgi:hypothetical protein
MPSTLRWALLLAAIVIAVSSAATPAAASDDDDCWGCAPGSCDRLSRPPPGGRKLLWDDDDADDDDDGDDDDDRFYYTCRQCLNGFTLTNDTDDGVIYSECGELAATCAAPHAANALNSAASKICTS